MQSESSSSHSQYDQINGFLLCAIVAKRARHLGNLMPGRRVPELISLALENCLAHKVKLHVNPGTPEVILREATEISNRNICTVAPQKAVPDHAQSNELHGASGNGFRMNPSLIRGAYSAKNSDGIDTMRTRQFRAIATSLCLEANRQREEHNYLIAYGLYDRALYVLQVIPVAEPETTSLVRQILQDQQIVFETLRASEHYVESTESRNCDEEAVSFM